MDIKKVLITGGCGFVGSNLAIYLSEKVPRLNIVTMDNYFRKGSLINKKRLNNKNIATIKGDIRYKKDFKKISDFDLLIDCAADPSALSGLKNGLNYLIDTNLIGTLNSLEAAKKNNAKIIFTSSSRIYPFDKINKLNFYVKNNEFVPNIKNKIIGFDNKLGISEKFDTSGLQTFYGFSKYSSENLIHEYCSAFNMQYIINRSGVISGPWQWGKADQGFLAFWLINYSLRKKLNLIGYGANGFQVRDVLNVQDFCEIIKTQINNFNTFENDIFNIGGGFKNKISLFNLNQKCQKLYNYNPTLGKITNDRYGDIPYYVSDYSKIKKIISWEPKISVDQTVHGIYNWVKENINLISKNL